MLMMAGCDLGNVCATSVAAASGTRPAITTLRYDMGPPGWGPPAPEPPLRLRGHSQHAAGNGSGVVGHGLSSEHRVHVDPRRVQDRQGTVGGGDRHRKVRAPED